MNTQELAQEAVKVIEGYRSNKEIMDFVTREALEQTAKDIRAKTGSGTTAKAVQLLIIKNEEVLKRFEEYVNLGLIGCFWHSLSN